MLDEVGPSFNDLNPYPGISVSATGIGFVDTNVLRDYFAAAALPAVIRNWQGVQKSELELARTAYKMADAMMIARQKKTMP